ncbi:MAG: hypothetical protein ACPGU1_14610 [Myxococcota bacterium]
MTRAADALDAAINGEDEAWERAELAYGQAARASLLEPYPLWVLEVITAWRQDQGLGHDPAVVEVLQALRSADYPRAQSVSEALTPSKGQELVARLVSDLVDASARRTAP